MGGGGGYHRVPLQTVNKNSLENVLRKDLSISESAPDMAKSDLENEEPNPKLSSKEKYNNAMQTFEKGKLLRVDGKFSTVRVCLELHPPPQPV